MELVENSYHNRPLGVRGLWASCRIFSDGARKSLEVRYTKRICFTGISAFEYQREYPSSIIKTYQEIIWTRLTPDERRWVETFMTRANDEDMIPVLQDLYDKKLGEMGSKWNNGETIPYKYAKIKLGDLFDFYTNSEGILQFPPWHSFQYVVDQYLEEARRFNLTFNSLLRNMASSNSKIWNNVPSV